MVAIISLSLAWLMAWIAIDRWQRQPDPEFFAAGIPLLAWYVLGVACLAGLLRYASSPRPPLTWTTVLALGVTPCPLLLMSVAAYLMRPPWFWAACAASAVYAGVYLMKGLSAIDGRPQGRAAAAGVIFIAAFVAASDALDAIPDLWSPGDSAYAVRDDALADREAALFEQAARIDASLEAVHRDGATSDAFFLGFAGVGEQKVFAQEIRLASHVLARRFGAAERQLSLINDERDLTLAPLASVTGLGYALQGLAQRMNLEQDVLFLAISSHGSEEPAIAVSNSQFPLTALTSEDLLDALEGTGIKWRVIIISACYAGGFIDSLRDPRSIVITAAAAGRTSFGCSSDRDLTYFGEAFYRDALPGARSLRDAFETAKAAIAAREKRENVAPSEPQAYFGAELESKLNGMAAAN